jgi:hypothetical protein
MICSQDAPLQHINKGVTLLRNSARRALLSGLKRNGLWFWDAFSGSPTSTSPSHTVSKHQQHRCIFNTGSFEINRLHTGSALKWGANKHYIRRESSKMGPISGDETSVKNYQLQHKTRKQVHAGVFQHTERTLTSHIRSHRLAVDNFVTNETWKKL